MEFSKNARDILSYAGNLANESRHEFVTPEHILSGMMNQSPFVQSLFLNEIDYLTFDHELKQLLSSMERVPDNIDYEIEVSFQADEVMRNAELQARNSDVDFIDVPHIAYAILELPESPAASLILSSTSLDKSEVLANIVTCYDSVNNASDEDDDFPYDLPFDDDETAPANAPWQSYITCLNDHLQDHNPLIGREAELQRTIQVLCRKDKNNPLHIGEPGVGKTALVYGLAAMIERGDVPERLKGYCIYQMNIGDLLAGTQYRGDFEKRLKLIMDGISQSGKSIVYIDEIHNLVGAGQTGEGSMDASNMLKPYFEAGDIRFIGSTTYQEFNRYMSKSRSLLRRFQQIDIAEPSIPEAIKILEGLKANYEQYHNVCFDDDVIAYAVEMSAKHINDRFLPDKAIDLIDEAGAQSELDAKLSDTQQENVSTPSLKGGVGRVSRADIRNVLQKICKIDAAALRDDDNTQLENLDERISADIYGQQQAVSKVVEAVQLSKAGLTDDNKPIASLLFVGPTGVGKTEVARVLARELGIELVRFDMSEYTEKHAVAKLIGSPAGYVGYEDGGQLTDAIRKTPNCVLLLDEIEKAHPDIYNILLQVMDYARLTDNKGQKADFRNVILILTSNAGAQYASQANVGFQGNTSAGEAMLQQVRKTFKPEFINRLSSIVVFRDMDMPMASLILDKKIRQLQQKLDTKNVTLQLDDQARSFLLQKGFTTKYGAREMDRIIQQHLTPLLMRAILFGSLAKGGTASVTLKDDTLIINDAIIDNGNF